MPRLEYLDVMAATQPHPGPGDTADAPERPDDLEQWFAVLRTELADGPSGPLDADPADDLPVPDPAAAPAGPEVPGQDNDQDVNATAAANPSFTGRHRNPAC